MCEVLTMAQIEERYDGEWVLLEDAEADEVDQVTSGRLLCHSKDRGEVYRKARELRPKHWAVFYVGTIPGDRVIMLSACPSTNAAGAAHVRLCPSTKER